ncbi:MAG: mannose-1-phosphate guanylyltransferase/mannose-6-phosphate isomerase [Shewanella sp.]|nr:mannose-1-phosphate guanylyltransferase/mannose-6-phosphate isomerase [Shewanella sp.]
MKIIPVIMAGGNGTRLWPLSRKAFPKQFLKLIGEKTLLQQTCERAAAVSSDEIVLICNEEHRFLCAEQLRQQGLTNYKILLEPVGKNTGPAIALAAAYIKEHHEDAVMVVMSADHYIEDIAYFADTSRFAAENALQGDIITFGITPTHAETGYGYIRKGLDVSAGIHQINKFVEKPNKATAESYLNSGEYLWNSGMFIMLASSYLAELAIFEPEMQILCEKGIQHAATDMDFIRPCPETFSQCPENSIDYAVMEKTHKGRVIEFNSKWSDIGAWSSIWELAEKDAAGNHCTGETTLVNAKQNLIYSPEKRTAVLGLDNVIVIDTKDALLVAAKDQVQDIKQVVEQLKAQVPELTENHRLVYRPWGHYDSIGQGERYQVKKISVKPGEKLSVQMHYHRAEHWIVVKGTAHVTIGQQETLVSENESVYIPIGEVHCLENKGKIPLELIEVQSGAYLGEDDIVRFNDIYGRVN